jgi:hypothetical protein
VTAQAVPLPLSLGTSVSLEMDLGLEWLAPEVMPGQLLPTSWTWVPL